MLTTTDEDTLVQLQTQLRQIEAQLQSVQDLEEQQRLWREWTVLQERIADVQGVG